MLDPYSVFKYTFFFILIISILHFFLLYEQMEAKGIASRPNKGILAGMKLRPAIFSLLIQFHNYQATTIFSDGNIRFASHPAFKALQPSLSKKPHVAGQFVTNKYVLLK